MADVVGKIERLRAHNAALLHALRELLAVTPHRPPAAGLIEGIEDRHARAIRAARDAIASATRSPL